MQFYEKNIYKVMIFRFYPVYKKREMIKTDNQTKEEQEVLSQVLE